jgi:hypothetical protein
MVQRQGARIREEVRKYFACIFVMIDCFPRSSKILPRGAGASGTGFALKEV